MTQAIHELRDKSSALQRTRTTAVKTGEKRLSHLKALEAESIYILREAVAEFSHPVMLYSIGKDSSVMLRLAQKAFYPGKIPFPLLHIDRSSETRSKPFRARHTKMLRTIENQSFAGWFGGRGI